MYRGGSTTSDTSHCTPSLSVNVATLLPGATTCGAVRRAGESCPQMRRRGVNQNTRSPAAGLRRRSDADVLARDRDRSGPAAELRELLHRALAPVGGVGHQAPPLPGGLEREPPRPVVA